MSDRQVGGQTDRQADGEVFPSSAADSSPWTRPTWLFVLCGLSRGCLVNAALNFPVLPLLSSRMRSLHPATRMWTAWPASKTNATSWHWHSIAGKKNERHFLTLFVLCVCFFDPLLIWWSLQVFVPHQNFCPSSDFVPWWDAVRTACSTVPPPSSCHPL